MKKIQLIGWAVAANLAMASATAGEIVKTNNAVSLISGSSWVGGVAPTSADTAVFDDTYAQNGGVNLTSGGQLEWNGIRVAGSTVAYQIQLQNGNLNWVGVGSGGIDLSASPRNLLIGSLNVSADQTWTTKAGLTLWIGMNTTSGNSGRRFSGAGDVILAGNGKAIIGGADNAKLFTGDLTVQSGVTLQMASSSAYGTSAGGITVQSGGTLINSANNDARGETIYVEGIGDGSGAIQAITATAMSLFSDVRLTGDASFGGAARFDIGLPTGGTITNVVLDLAGHTLTKIGNNQLQLKGGIVSDGSLDISSGIVGFETGLTVAGSGTVHLRNGGTLLLFRASAGSPLTISRSMLFDDGAYLHWTGQKTPEEVDVTVHSPIAMSGTPIISVDGAGGSAIELAGTLSGTGAGFYKFGTNTLLLSGTNSYTGTAEVDAGTVLGVTGGSSAGSTVHVLDVPGAAFGVRVRDNSRPWSCSGLTLDGANSGLIFNFGYTVAPSTTIAPLQVNGDVAFGGASVVTIRAGAIPAGTGSYPLLAWTGNFSGTTPTSVVLPSHVQGNLSVVGKTLFLNVTANGQPLNWAAGNGDWDIGASPNWQDATGAGGQYYLETALPGDNVLFGDLPGAGNYTVTLNSTVTPASITVSNSIANYTVTGSGAMAGQAALNKRGNGTLILSNSANAYQGGTTVAAGTLILGRTNSLGLPANSTNLATVLSGGTLDINGQNLNDTYSPSAGYTITIAGTGTAGAGALTSSTTPPDNRGVPNLRLASDATIGSDAESKFWIRGGISGAHTLTKIGSNTVVITAGTIINSEVPALVVSNGTLSTSATLGATPVRVYGPGILALYTGSGIVFTNSLTLADGSTLLQTNGPNGWAAPIQMSGNVTFEVGRGSLNVSGSLNGTGSLTKTGAQQLTLAGTNNAYAGNVSLTAGVLEAAADTSLGAGNVTVASGATLQLDTPATMNAAASLTLADATAVANLNYSGTQTIAALSFDGGITPAATGTWGAIGSGAVHESASLTGTGLLDVTSGSSVTPIQLAAQVSGGTLTLTWPDLGWYAQSNSVNIAHSNEWFDIPGSETGTNLVRTVDSTRPHVFYRLRHP